MKRYLPRLTLTFNGISADGSTRLVKSLAISAMGMPDRIVLNPAVCYGKPVIRGSRVPVTVLVGSLACGMTFEEVQREYEVTAEDIRAALRYLTELAQHESCHPLPNA